MQKTFFVLILLAAFLAVPSAQATCSGAVLAFYNHTNNQGETFSRHVTCPVTVTDELKQAKTVSQCAEAIYRWVVINQPHLTTEAVVPVRINKGHETICAAGELKMEESRWSLAIDEFEGPFPVYATVSSLWIQFNDRIYSALFDEEDLISLIFINFTQAARERSYRHPSPIDIDTEEEDSFFPEHTFSPKPSSHAGSELSGAIK